MLPSPTRLFPGDAGEYEHGEPKYAHSWPQQWTFLGEWYRVFLVPTWTEHQRGKVLKTIQALHLFVQDRR